MFSLVFSKEKGQMDSDQDPRHNKYFFYLIPLIMEKMGQQMAILKLKRQVLFFFFMRDNYFLLYNVEWGHSTILVCIDSFNISDSY